jgi:predicted DNA-binding transcriptional regulator YafY
MLKFSGQVRTAVEDYFTEKEIEYDEQGDLIVRTQMPESGWLYGFILSYGSFVEVLEPKEYRQILRREASKIKRLYDKKTPA